MELSDNQRFVIDYFFSKPENKSYPWVAFDFTPKDQVNYLKGFKTAYEAEKFCNAANNQFDYAKQDFVDASYRYMPVQALTDMLSPSACIAFTEVSPEVLKAQFAAHDVQPLRASDLKNSSGLARAGWVFPVQYDRVIDPAKEVDQFLVVEHRHAGHHIYEIGHSVKVIERTDSLEKAEAVFKDMAKEYPGNTDRNDYRLIGLYRGQQYDFDLEGNPEDYSGLTLKTAVFPSYMATTREMKQIHDLSEPKTIENFLFAQFSHQEGRLKLLDNGLNEVSPETLNKSIHPGYFIYEKLTIKQLEIMNEQSYDYVSNQLKYLGFGEEIAKPLREKMAEGLKDFTLNHSREFGKDKTENVLYFSKGDDLEKDLTFFNRFETTLKQEGKADLTQNFFVGKEYNYTLQERYNMMDGRFVFREQPKVAPQEVNGETKMVPTGETYTAWKGLNFKETDERGNFMPKTMFWRHDKEVVKYPIKGIDEKYDLSRLLASLEKGNKANVTIIRGDDEIKGSVAANPKMQRFDFYDANGQTLFIKQVDKQKLAKTENQEQAQQQNQAAARKQETGQSQQQSQWKNEITSQAGQQNNTPAAEKGQGEHQKTQPVQKEGQQSAQAEEQKANTGQRKRTGLKI